MLWWVRRRILPSISDFSLLALFGAPSLFDTFSRLLRHAVSHSSDILLNAGTARLDESIIVGVIYRSPNTQDQDNQALSRLICEVSSKFRIDRLILIGDFNHPEIDWVAGTCDKSTEHNAYKFLASIEETFLNQLVHEPTHFRSMQTPTLIDLLFTNDSDIKLHPPLGLSHHCNMF